MYSFSIFISKKDLLPSSSIIEGVFVGLLAREFILFSNRSR